MIPFIQADAQSSGASIPVQILILIVLILFNAFFALSEIALITLNDNKIKKMADDGDKTAKKILNLTGNSSKFLATIQVGVTLSGFLTSASASQSFSDDLTQSLSWIPISPTIISGISTFIITIILSYFSLVLGELVPKKIAMQNAEALSFKVVGVLQFTAKMFSPFIRFLSFSTNLVLKILGFDPNSSEETVTEEEILMMVDVGQEKGVIQETTKDMIENIFEFDNTIIEEIMTHRTEIQALEDTQSIRDAAKLAISVGYSRIPVYHEDLDDIIGIVYVKDLLKYVYKEVPQETKLSDIMRPALFVPSSKQCDELFAEMISCKTQIAIVIDEYGGTAGLITLEDLIESIVGNIQDEYDNEKEEIFMVSENTFNIEGTALIDEVEDLLEIEIPAGEYDTIAGMMVSELGKIPGPNEKPSVTVDDVTFTVEEVRDKRISKITAIKNVGGHSETINNEH